MTSKGWYSFCRGLCVGCCLLDVWQSSINPSHLRYLALACLMGLSAVWCHWKVKTS